MPGLAFAANFLWVMVIGLLGPSIPAMIADLGIGYGQAGFLFTLLSLGSLFGTSLGAMASDYLDRKTIFGVCALSLGLGLATVGFMRGYVLVASLVFVLSLLGSPIGAIGQSVMLDMFPDKREKYLSLQTFFGASGSFLAPVLISFNYSSKLHWRWPFIETAFIAAALLAAILAVPLPKARAGAARLKLQPVLKNRKVLACAALIFFSVATDLGFSYWLTEYFKTELRAPLRLSSAIVGFYLAGIIFSRFLITRLPGKIGAERILAGGLALALASILIFILLASIQVKMIACVLYGLGIGPVFPLLMSRGVEEYPDQPGAVTGILFACLSLGGMVFPFLLGFLASAIGIERSYFFCAAVVAVLLLTVLRKKKNSAIPRRMPAPHS